MKAQGIGVLKGETERTDDEYGVILVSLFCSPFGIVVILSETRPSTKAGTISAHTVVGNIQVMGSEIKMIFPAPAISPSWGWG